jgi:hypothetical protein
MKYISSVLVLLIIACASTMTPRDNSREEIVAYVDRAARGVQENGPSCDMFADQRWLSGDWYIFVFDADGKTICHPVRPDLVGTNTSAVVDPNGKRIGDEMLRIVTTSGAGWVDYVWARPGQSTPDPKMSYVRRVTGPDGRIYGVGSGGYGLPG